MRSALEAAGGSLDIRGISVSGAAGFSKTVEYYDPVTLEDTTSTGGFALKPHGACRKMCVCQEKYCLPSGCFWCHAHVDQADYIPIGPRVEREDAAIQIQWAPPSAVGPRKLALSTLLFESRLNPVPGQVVVQGADYLDDPDLGIDTILTRAAEAIGLPAAVIRELLSVHPDLHLSGSLVPRILRHMSATTDADLYVHGDNAAAEAALRRMSEILDRLGGPHTVIHEGGVVTVRLKDGLIPLQIVRVSNESFSSVDDWLKSQQSPICQHAFSVAGGIRCSVEFLHWFQCAIAEWWQFNEDKKRVQHALKYRSYGFALAPSVEQQLDELAEKLHVSESQALTPPLPPPQTFASIDDIPKESIAVWLVGITKDGTNYIGTKNH